MMDARSMYPNGWHPQDGARCHDGTYYDLDYRPSRTAAGTVRYYFIDFGLSSINQDMTTGLYGLERAPELSNTEAYDPYKLDVYVLGKAFASLFLLVSTHVCSLFSRYY